MHVLQSSADELAAMIKRVRPHYVAVELCAAREKRLRQRMAAHPDGPGAGAQTDLGHGFARVLSATITQGIIAGYFQVAVELEGGLGCRTTPGIYLPICAAATSMRSCGQQGHTFHLSHLPMTSLIPPPRHSHFHAIPGNAVPFTASQTHRPINTFPLHALSQDQ